ncbi:hypothetical protein TNCT_611311 [Trichonephila clavata]|uniref:Uncharacterized protein n=1 Tax=Trichonephila clavata TaxID=2740835 RepID=A0A8X6HSM3_TRICU|nr:hypothetical protein TNCT_611311 [Trichonephila clavata]
MEFITVCTMLGLNCTGSAKELNKRLFKNLSDLASSKNNFTEDLTDDEDIDPMPVSWEYVCNWNKQLSTPQTGPFSALNKVVELSPNLSLFPQRKKFNTTGRMTIPFCYGNLFRFCFHLQPVIITV